MDQPPCAGLIQQSYPMPTIPSQFWRAVVGVEPVAEYRFHDTRRWRFDYAFPDAMLAVEIEGGVWIKGRHTRGAGYVNDMEKYNTAIEMGWRVLRYQPTRIDYDQIKRCLRIRIPGPS